jgi:nucleoside-diphosphate-sugar epimerase
VTGPTLGALNVLPAIGVYAAIRREKGEPFSFPGGPSFVREAADADLVGDVMVWAAESARAANEAFNITNGDVFEWRSVWPALAETPGRANRAGHADQRGCLHREKCGCLEPNRRKVIDSEQAFRNALQSLIERKLPPPRTIPQQIYKNGSIRGAKQRGEFHATAK